MAPNSVFGSVNAQRPFLDGGNIGQKQPEVNLQYHSAVSDRFDVLPPQSTGAFPFDRKAERPTSFRVYQILTNLRQIADMTQTLSSFVGLALKAGAVLLVLNEVRGLILAVPVLFAMYEAGGTWMAIWIALCSLGGIALSVVVPLIVARKLLRRIPAA
ncbi:hypothetical protein SAMN05428974_3833 [Sphingopyxis sp. YR583]|uniref:hypothetical protein n=1 Tax=Sphingopyxis sp. YR583 TaxID=1881047 RepID=UPI0008A7E792|nr:hypothetical protein [Sphingopyxis sp. YR583]SEH20087.1 hypothetical protein SAMN05428974_3833 [Sphingopyxis sp. YR583]